MRAITLALGLLIIIFHATAAGQNSGAPDQHGWVDVRSELSPENHFSFQVIAEGGSRTTEAL
jgi:hypothetical protein